MPKIYEYFGLIFLFYSNDHLPVHVHVMQGECNSKFEFVYEDGELVDIKIIKAKNPLNEKQTKNSLRFIKKYHTKISEKWYQFFVLHKTPKCRKITTKI